MDALILEEAYIKAGAKSLLIAYYKALFRESLDIYYYFIFFKENIKPRFRLFNNSYSAEL